MFLTIQSHLLITTPLRSMRWNSATPVFAYGNGSALISPPISLRAVQIHPPGERHLQISPARIATSVLISRTRVLLLISLCVVIGLVRASTILHRVAVLATAQHLCGITRLVSRPRTGNSVASRSIRLRDMFACQAQFSFLMCPRIDVCGASIIVKAFGLWILFEKSRVFRAGCATIEDCMLLHR